MTLYLHVGQCGVQLGQELWATLERELDGASPGARSQGSRRVSDGFSDFFDDHGGAHALFVDSDSRWLERVSPCLATRGGMGAGAVFSGGGARLLEGSSSGGGERASGGRMCERGAVGAGGGGDGGDGVRFSSGTHLRRCSASNLVAGRGTGHSDLWAKAYFGPSVFSAGGEAGRGREGGTGWRAGEDLVALTQEAIRRRAEAMDRLYGFSFLHSLAGGTGGGLTSALLQNLRDLYPKAFLLCCAVGGGGDFSANASEESVSGALRSSLRLTDPVLAHRGGSGPALGYSKLTTFRAPWSCLYAYNAALTVAYLQTFADAVVFKDNQQMLYSAALRRKRARGEGHSRADKATATESAGSVGLSELNQTIVEDLLGLYLPTTNCRRRSSVYSTVWPEVSLEQQQRRALGSCSASFSYSSPPATSSSSFSASASTSASSTSSMSGTFSARPFFPGDILTDVCPMDGAKFLDLCTVFHQDKKWAGGRAYGPGTRSLSAAEQSTSGRYREGGGQRDALTHNLYSRQPSEDDARVNKGRHNASGNLRTARHIPQDPRGRNHGKGSGKGLRQLTKSVEVFSREEQDVLEGLEKQFHLLRPKFLTGTSRPNLSVASRLVLRGPFSGPVDLLSSSFSPTESSRGAHSPFLRDFARRFLRDHPHVTWNCISSDSSSSSPSSCSSFASSASSTFSLAGAASPRVPAASSSILSPYSSASSFSHSFSSSSPSSSSFASSSSSSLRASFSPPLSFSFSSSAFLPAHRRRYSLTVCSNRCGIAESLRQIVEKGERAFAARAFWHWYERAGLEEDLLDAAFDTCRDVVRTYADLAEE